MKYLMTAMLMATLYWNGTKQPIEQYSKVSIVCGEFEGKFGLVNYTWADGSVDVLYISQIVPGYYLHFYVRDYRCLEQGWPK